MWQRSQPHAGRVGWLVTERAALSWPGVVMHHGDIERVEIVQGPSNSRSAARVYFSNSSSADFYEYDRIECATGYSFDFAPFLDSMTLSQQLGVAVTEQGRVVSGLYKHLVPIQDATIAFVGLPIRVIPFRVADAQAAFLSRLWQKRREEEAIEQRRREAENDAEHIHNVVGLAARHFHVLDSRQFDYMNELYRGESVVPKSVVEGYKASGMLQKTMPPGVYQKCLVIWDETTQRIAVMKNRLTTSKL